MVTDKMLKIILWCFFSVIFAFEVNARYVRKHISPDFFIPEYDNFNKPEKLPPIKKIKKEGTVKKISRVDNEQKKVENSNNKENINTNEYKQTSLPNIVDNSYTIPSYQQQFDKYSSDIEYISKYKTLPVNEDLEKDLADVNSDNLFKVVYKNNYKKSKVSSEFENLLKQVTEN